MRPHILSVVLAFVTGWAATAGAQDYTGRPVKTVRVQGLVRVSEQLARSKLEVQAGQPYNAGAVARDIRRLYELGSFQSIRADVTPEDDGVILAYVVEEKRYIGDIRIMGNKKINARQIESVLSWRAGDSFVEDAYNEEREAILKLYRSKGFLNADVAITVEEVGPSRVRVTYAIQEGKKARIRGIRFEGNEVLSDRRLRKVMKTRPARWFLGGRYDQDKFEADLKNILGEYGNHGRLEAEIQGSDFDYSDSGKKVEITIRVQEGPEYRVGTLETAGNVVFDDDEVVRLLKVRAGDVHNKGQVEKDAEFIQKGYQDSGYVNAVVEPQVTLNREDKTTHVIHRVTERDLKYIREIKVTGNASTRDEVVRREVLLEPGERFDGSLLRASQQRLENTEYYDEVRITLEDVEANDRFSNILIDVDEGKTGYFNFGAGYSTEEKFGGYTELQLDNFDISNPPSFSGGGQRFRLRLHLGQVRSQYSLSFTDPEIMGYPLAFGFDLFDESYKYTGGVEFEETTTGGQIRFGKVLSPFVTARTALRFTDVTISDMPRDAAPSLRREIGGSTTVSTIWGINRSTVDVVRDPTRGAQHDFQLQLAGLGGDNHFYKFEHDSTWYRPLGEEKKWILMFRTREGIANEFGDSQFVPISDRFFAGGATTVRGYDSRDIGPKEQRSWFSDDMEAVGGNLRLLNTLELKYKLTEKVRFYTFLDAGGVWQTMGDFDPGDIKYSAGLGFGVFIPKMGPLRVDYGIPINPDADQGSGKLHLQTGLRF